MEDAATTLYCAACLTTFGTDGEGCPNLGCGRPRPGGGWGRMFQPGEVMDRNYEVEKTLALGGAGVTYLVKGLDTDGAASGPRIALKLLFASRDHGAYLQRLATEAQILQQLDHPHIVQYLGFVHRQGHSPYLLTLYESGGSLLDHMRRVGTLSIKSAARIGRQVCWALEKGHSRDIIHRDLKPENLLLTEAVERDGDPHIRVADFGIAKVQGSLGSGLTRSGAFVGTPQYAAPEQFIGEVATAAADVYSLGSVLVFLMTARPIIKKAHLSAPEDVYLKLEEKLPASINRPKDSEDDNRRMNLILSRATQFDPTQRCSIQQLDRMLAALLDDQEPEIGPPPSQGEAEEPDPGVSLMSLPPVHTPDHGQTSADPIEPRTEPASATQETRRDDALAPPDDVVTRDLPSDAPPVQGPRQGRRWGLVVALVVVLGVLVAGGMLAHAWWKTPWKLEGTAIGGQTAHSIIGVGTAKAKARRQSVKPQLKREIKGFWPMCSKSKRPRKDLQLEMIVEPDGTIRWVRPARDDAPSQHWCVTEQMRFLKLKRWSAKRPIRARVKVDYE